MSSHVPPLLDPACVAEPTQLGAACVMPNASILCGCRGLFSLSPIGQCGAYSVGAVMLLNMAWMWRSRRAASVIAGKPAT
jgi:hypothetical protein